MGDLKPFWISWWDDEDIVFELHSPWWFTGHRFNGSDDDEDDRGQASVCAAVMAIDAEDAMRLVVEADDDPVVLDWRFVSGKPDGWSPFCDRFRRADWMCWPLSPLAQAQARTEDAA